MKQHTMPKTKQKLYSKGPPVIVRCAKRGAVWTGKGWRPRGCR